MVFAGAVPRQCIEQVFRILDMSRVERAYICCSGSFRFEQALLAHAPNIQLHSNDVSLLSTAIGRHLTREPLSFRFVESLSWLEEALAGASSVTRLAAIAIALDISRYRGSSEFARRHMAHYRANIAHYLGVATEKMTKYLEGLRIESFFAGDFREHARRGAAEGGLVLSWPPTIKNAYERDFRFVNMNVAWEPPPYDVFDPKDLAGWIAELRELGALFCILSDQRLEEHAPSALYTTGRAKRFYAYTSDAESSSLRRNLTRATPFRYRLVEPPTLRADTRVDVIEVSKEAMNFIKDKYQLPGLVHTDGLYRFLVFLDGALAGGFVYSWMSGKSFPSISRLKTIYLLSDFATSRRRKLSKLIAMLATGGDSVERLDRRSVRRSTHIVTSTFTGRPVSMKYRGIFKLLSRRTEGSPCVNYISEVRRVPNSAIYADWWRRYGSAPDPDDPASAQGAHDPGVEQERPVHEGGAVQPARRQSAA